MANRYWSQFGWTLEKAVTSLWANVGFTDTSTVTAVADVASSLAGTFFRIKGYKAVAAGTQYLFWFSVNGAGADPSTAADVGIEVVIPVGASDVAVAQAIYNAAISATNTQFNTDFTFPDPSTAAVVFTALGGGCANAHDGLSAFATGFAFANAVGGSVANATSSKAIKSFARTGTGLYTLTLGTPAPTSVTDLYPRVFTVKHAFVSTTDPAAPYMYVVSQAVSSAGTVNLKFLAADGTTAADPACTEVLLLEIVLKNTTAQ